eukprot:jgi/Undpi1/9530/HiC_scaffold_27.g11986.m1
MDAGHPRLGHGTDSRAGECVTETSGPRRRDGYKGKNGIPLLSKRRTRDVELMMNDDTWLKFVVVRDPADRLLSGFLNKCLGTEWQNCPYVRFMPHRFEGVDERNATTDAASFCLLLNAINLEPRKVFRDFMVGVKQDVKERGCKVNSHWRPQYCFCSIARFRDSYHVIPFANMSMEAVKLVDHMPRPSPDRAALLREFMVTRFSTNLDAKAQGAASKREKYFSEEALDIVTSRGGGGRGGGGRGGAGGWSGDGGGGGGLGSGDVAA